MPTLHVAESMTRFRCNQKGCCCSEWNIVFEADDVFELYAALPEDLRAGLLSASNMQVEGGVVHTIQIATLGPERRCRFLASDGGCGVHATLGPEILPHLCRTFPAFAFQRPDGAIQVQYDPVCPQVLEQLDEDDGPLTIARIDPADHPDVGGRAERPQAQPALSLGDHPVTPEAFDAIRATIIDAINQRRGAALDVLALVSHGLARAALGHPFTIAPGDPIAPFERYLDQAVAAHHGPLLALFFIKYRRFLFVDGLPEGDWQDFAAHLRAPATWREVVDPRDPALDPLIGRYLVNRFFNTYDRSRFDNQLALSYGLATFILATALRYLVGLCRWLSRPPDRALLKAALGAAEFFYRTISLDALGLPWFGLELVERPAPPTPDGPPTPGGPGSPDGPASPGRPPTRDGASAHDQPAAEIDADG